MMYENRHTLPSRQIIKKEEVNVVQKKNGAILAIMEHVIMHNIIRTLR